MPTEKTIALSVRVEPKTKTYLDGLAEKKGVGVARVLDQIVAELDDTPDEVYYLKYTTHFCFLSTFMIHRLFVASGHMEKEQANYQSIQKVATEIFGPAPTAPKSFETFDPATVPPVFQALYSALDRLLPESPPASPQTSSSVEPAQC